MGDASAQLIGRVLQKCGVAATVDLRAMEALSTALAAILRASGERSLEALENLAGFPAGGLGSLTAEERGFLQGEVDSRVHRADESAVGQLQGSVQGLLEPSRRKRLAAYYTKPQGVALMAEMARLYSQAHAGSRLVLADPFLGSGLTLTGAIKRLGEGFVAMAWGIEPYALSALTAYAALLYQLGGDPRRVHVRLGDAFASPGLGSDAAANACGPLPNADIVLTNPPFTRWELLDGKYRAFLREAVLGSAYSRFLTRRQLNLQLVAFFLIDRILKPGGLLLSVLPASTFYTIAGGAVKRLLRESYTIHALAESLPEASFSTDSGFKELILAAAKEKPCRVRETAFISLGESLDVDLAARAALTGKAPVVSNAGFLHSVNLYGLQGLWDMNWLVYFGESSLRRIVMEMLSAGEKKGVLGPWARLFGEQGMVRGVEMYGPSFFFLPNEHWRLLEEERNSILIAELKGRRSLRLPRRFLVASLRRPGLYAHAVKVQPRHYFLALPPLEPEELPHDVAEYVRWGLSSGAARPAIQAFGSHWYAHVYRQLEAKRPYGRVFLPDKVDPGFEHRGVFASYSERPVTASKNFYILRSNDTDICRLLAAWFNSSLFLGLLLLVGRRISETWTRFLEEDYMRLPALNVDELDDSAKSSVRGAFEKLLGLEALPPLKEQLMSDYRLEMDAALAEAFGLPEPESSARQLHSVIAKRLDRRLS